MKRTSISQKFSNLEIGAALRIVLELAEQNLIEDEDMPEESFRQREAVRIIEHVLDEAFKAA